MAYKVSGNLGLGSRRRRGQTGSVDVHAARVALLWQATPGMRVEAQVEPAVQASTAVKAWTEEALADPAPA